jgi:protein-S-isoprenylcysteine O-methyltransferase Ste14
VNQSEKFIYNAHPYLLVSIGTILLVLQIALAFFFHQNYSPVLINGGWVILWTAGFFGVIPIFTFRRKGRVEKGKSYMHTTKLVDTGIYAIVRHPQNGVAWVLINVGVMLIAQHWLIVVIGGLSMVCAYLDLFKEEQRCIEKFGDEYRRYMEKVPRINLLLGLIRAIRRKGK